MTTTIGSAPPSSERSRHRRWPKRVLFVVTAVAAGIAISLATYATSVEPGAAIIKAVFEAKPEVTPPAHFAAIAATVSEKRGIPIVTPGAPDATLDIYAPKDAGAGLLPVILWIHGGGFVSSTADTVKDYVTLLASHGYVVANLDYTLAPGAKHPVPVKQANSALAYLSSGVTRYGGDPTRIMIGGDSAGAQIASELGSLETSAALAARLDITPALTAEQLRGVILFCGLYDMDTVGSTGFPGLRTYLWAYTGSRTWTEYADISALSTVATATPAFPPTFISVGDADPFRVQGSELATALKSRGVPVTTLFWNGTGDNLGHEYQFDFDLPQATTAFNRTLDFISTRTTGAQQ